MQGSARGKTDIDLSHLALSNAQFLAPSSQENYPTWQLCLFHVMNGNSHSISPALKFLGVLIALCYRARRVRCNHSTQCYRVTICTSNLFLWEQEGFEQPNAMVVLSCKCGGMMAVSALAALQCHMAFSTTAFVKPFTSCFLHICINTSKL